MKISKEKTLERLVLTLRSLDSLVFPGEPINIARANLPNKQQGVACIITRRARPSAVSYLVNTNSALFERDQRLCDIAAYVAHEVRHRLQFQPEGPSCLFSLEHIREHFPSFYPLILQALKPYRRREQLPFEADALLVENLIRNQLYRAQEADLMSFAAHYIRVTPILLPSEAHLLR